MGEADLGGSLHSSKVMEDQPTVPVFPVVQWKHLSDFELADLEYGISAGVDILLKGKGL